MNFYHLGKLVFEQAETYKNKTALKYLDSHGNWVSMSWEKLSEKTMKTAQALVDLGVERGARIGIYSQNMSEYLISEFAGYTVGAVMASIYATSSPSQVRYIIDDAEIGVLFVGEQFQYNNAYKVKSSCKSLKRLIVFDRRVVFHQDDNTSIYFDDFIAMGDNSETLAVVKSRLSNLRFSDLATLIYTSGTTGEPKGVMLTHDNYINAFINNSNRLDQINDKDVSMSFLPLAHVFEKTWCYLCLERAVKVVINHEPRDILKTIKQIKPTVMCNVPRFWEKTYEGISEKIEQSGKILKWLFNDALQTGKRYNLEFKNQNKKAPFGLSLKFRIYQSTVFYLIKREIGVQKGNFFPTAGAPLSDKINEFLQSLDIKILTGYGLSETTATVSCFTTTGFTIGTVGKVLPELDVKIGENNEILIKGGTIMKGYYKKPKETQEAFTEDGYLRTGDIGSLNENNEIILTDRLKDLYKTSNGKYIAPQMIETRLCESRYIDQVAVIANERKFASALLVPNFDAIQHYARDNKIEFETNEDLVKNKEIIGLISAETALLQAQFASFEQVKKISLLPKPFTIESGELTNTLKIKRQIIITKYADIIEKMYS